MDDLKKDPYLSELDAMDNFEPPPPELTAEDETVQEHDEPTRVDLKAPPVPQGVRGAAPAAPAHDPFAMPDAEPGTDAAIEDVDDIMDVMPEGPAPVKELLDLSPDLTVPLVIVIGRKSYTVKDLLGLRIGQVMDLERAPNEPVDLVAAGKVVGKGELVDVDGRLGIRILKLLK
ncbi:MAG TPA: FliM/FliN family flagellar motor switch protein [bacterium]|nr:FliM/FliN family flagellar motor switch protein [bacterium]